MEVYEMVTETPARLLPTEPNRRTADLAVDRLDRSGPEVAIFVPHDYNRNRADVRQSKPLHAAAGRRRFFVSGWRWRSAPDDGFEEVTMADQ